MRSMLALVALAALACAQEAPTEAPPEIPRPYASPAEVKVVDAVLRAGDERVTVDHVTFVSQEVVTVDLANEGGPGAYRVEFRGPGPDGAELLWFTSFPTLVNGGIGVSETWTIDVSPRAVDSAPRVQSVVVFTRQPNYSYIETSRFAITDWQF